MATPTKPITDPGFQYRNAASTDVTLTWRKYGWVPPSEKQSVEHDPNCASLTRLLLSMPPQPAPCDCSKGQK